MKRREFLRTAGGATGGTAAVAAGAGTATAQEKKPDFGGWLEGVDGGFKDARGSKEVTVQVGAQGNGGSFAFSPAGLWVDTGTTVKWEWTGQGGGHNVHATEGADFQSEIFSEPGVHFQHTFEEGGIVNYQCDPHAALGMKGAVAVGDDVPTKGGGGGEGGDGGGGGGTAVTDSAKTLGIATMAAMLSTLAFAYVFIKYGGGPEPEEV